MTGNRLVLVIASQCTNAAPLSLLPPGGPDGWAPGDPVDDDQRIAFDLYDQFCDPDAGACSPVPGLAQLPGVDLCLARPGLLINPPHSILKGVVKHAYEKAIGTPGLVIYFVGHGVVHQPSDIAATEHYLLVSDSPARPKSDDQGLDLWGELHRARQETQVGLASLLVVADVCFAGVQAAQTFRNAPAWVTNQTNPVGFIGSSGGHAAYDGCFTRELTRIMATGLTAQQHKSDSVPQTLGLEIHATVNERCSGQQSTDAGWDTGNVALFVCLNRARSDEDLQLGFTATTARKFAAITSGRPYVPIGLEELVASVKDEPFSVIVGAAGTGKSRLSAVLRRPPDGILAPTQNAVVFADRQTTRDALAEELHYQLLGHPNYKQAHQYYASRNRQAYNDESPYFRYLIGPLSVPSLADARLRVVIDGLDQLDDSHRDDTIGALTELCGLYSDRLRIIATSRPDPRLPNGATEVEIPTPTPDQARSYLIGLGLDTPLAAQVLDALEGSDLNWLVLELAAAQADRDPSRISAKTGDLYGAIREAAIAEEAGDKLAVNNVDCVLAVLVAAGQLATAGPRLPYAILQSASQILGGPATPEAIYPVLAHQDLYRIIERSRPATADEHVGLFHPTAIDDLADRLSIPIKDAHSAIVDAIKDLTTIDLTSVADPTPAAP